MSWYGEIEAASNSLYFDNHGKGVIGDVPHLNSEVNLFKRTLCGLAEIGSAATKYFNAKPRDHLGLEPR